MSELNRINERRIFQLVIGTIFDLDLAAVIASEKYRTALYLGTSYKLMEDFKPEWKHNIGFYENHVKKMICAETWALNKVGHILASTQAISYDIDQAYGIKMDHKKLNILPFGVPTLTNGRVPKKNDKDLKLLFVGRFEYRKGIDLILEILLELLLKYKFIRFFCIGDNTIAAANGKLYTTTFLEKHSSKEWISRIKF